MHKILSASIVASLLAAGTAQATGSTAAQFNVTATVLSTCSASATAVNFPNYTPGAGAVTANGTITVKCTNLTPYTVKLNAGTTTGDAFTQRLMASSTGNYTLQYNLYTTSQLSTVFGDGSGTTGTSGGTGAGLATATTVTVYGQLPDSTTNQAAVTGSYSDVITATISY